MKQAIYDYLVSELYPFPNCRFCQYADINAHRKPCSTCDWEYNNYKLCKERKAELKKLTIGLIKIFKQTKK